MTSTQNHHVFLGHHLFLGLLFLAATLALLAGCKQNEAAARLPDAPPGGLTGSKAPGAAQTEPAKAANPAPAPAASGDGSFLLTGTTEPYRKSTISPKVAGTVDKVLVREGSTVKEGATLVLLDTADFRLQLKQAEAARATARAHLEATRVEWKRLSTLVKDRAVPRAQFDRVDAQLSVGKAGLAQADVAVAVARRRLNNGTVRAPFGGIVTRVMINRGEYAAMMPPTRLLTIEQIDKLELRIQVPETAMARVKEGTAIRAHFTAAARKIEGRITRVVRSVDARTRSFSAIAELDNRDGTLRPGMFAEVRLASGS